MKLLATLALLICTQCASAQVALNEKIVLTTANTVVFRGEVNDDSVMKAELKLFKLVAVRGGKDYPIYLVLDSPGGSIDAGLGFIEFAKVVRNLKTISIFAASMASGIAEGLPGERLVTQNGIMMFHRAAGRFQGYFETGEVESTLAFGKAIMRNMENVNATRMKLPIAQYKELVRSELWLYSTDNITNNAADKVVDLECTGPLIESKDSLSFATMFGDVNLTFSGCPLLRSPNGGDTSKYLVMSLTNYKLLQLGK